VKIKRYEKIKKMVFISMENFERMQYQLRQNPTSFPGKSKEIAVPQNSDNSKH